MIFKIIGGIKAALPHLAPSPHSYGPEKYIIDFIGR